MVKWEQMVLKNFTILMKIHDCSHDYGHDYVRVHAHDYECDHVYVRVNDHGYDDHVNIFWVLLTLYVMIMNVIFIEEVVPFVVLKV